MRKGFEGLYGLVRDRLSCEPLSGHLFLFCNGQRNRLKVLVWDGSGLWHGSFPFMPFSEIGRSNLVRNWGGLARERNNAR